MEIKGIKEGILVAINELDWQNARGILIEKIKEKKEFFRGAQLVLDINNTIIRTREIEHIRDALAEQGVELKGIISESIVTQKAAISQGLITDLAQPSEVIELEMKPLDTLLTGEKAVMIHRTMRSGYKVAYKGHVVIMGDVNPGAEVIASGSIIVWGHLRGTAHAGAEGDESAVICALNLSPTQLRIASRIATTPKGKEIPKPEIASIQNNQIIAELWQQ